MQHSTTNGDADVVHDDESGTITLKARNSIYQKSGIFPDNAQDVRTYCTLTNSTTYTLRITYSLSDNITRPDGVDQSDTIELSPNDSFPSSGTGFYVTKNVESSSTDTTYEIGTITITSIEKVENASLSLYSSSFGSYTYQVGSTSATMAKGGDTYTNASVQVGSAIALTATVDSAYTDTYVLKTISCLE